MTEHTITFKIEVDIDDEASPRELTQALYDAIRPVTQALHVYHGRPIAQTIGLPVALYERAQTTCHQEPAAQHNNLS